jgi:hypothetical protein
MQEWILIEQLNLPRAYCSIFQSTGFWDKLHYTLNTELVNCAASAYFY